MNVRLDSRVRRVSASHPEARPGGLVQALLAGLVALQANHRLRRVAGRFRAGHPPPVPDWLRRDVGLPPADPLPNWWDQPWK